MKKIIAKITFISIILVLLFSLKSFAESTFRFKIPDNVKLDAGEVTEIPIYIDSVNIEGVEKKILDFYGTLKYDKNVFELIPYQTGNNNSVVKINDELQNYGMEIIYNAETGKISTSLNLDFTRNMINKKEQNKGDEVNFLNGYIEIGTVKVKAKENAKPGDYEFTIADAQANNGEFEVEIGNPDTTIHINEPQKNAEINPIDNSSDEINHNDKTTEETSKKAILKIEVSKDGKKIIITPDVENGALISAITYNSRKLEYKDGSFVFDSEPNSVYEFFIYGADGSCLGNEFVKTIIKEENKQEGSKQEDNKKEETPAKENEKKSPQTADKISIAIAILSLMLIAIIATTIIKKK